MRIRKSSRLIARTQRGVTLIEIMIVLAIIGLVMGVIVGPRVIRSFQEAKVKTAWMMSNEYATAYVKWSTENDGVPCPEKIEDLTKYTNTSKADVNDPWGHKYIMKCGESAQTDTGFGVVSAGPDGKEGTPDDVHSWDTKFKTN